MISEKFTATNSVNHLSPVTPKADQNYIAFFLSLNCNLHCSYCINSYSFDSEYLKKRSNQLSADDWIMAANRLTLRDDLPLTLQGGEPILHRGFYRIVNEVRDDIRMDLLTNLTFDVNIFIKSVPVWRFTREAPYAPIRASYHPGQNDIDDMVKKTLRMQDAGFRVGIFAVLHPDRVLQHHILKTRDRLLNIGLDFRIKEFLGEWNGKLYGSYRYDGSVGQQVKKDCECRTSEIIVDPEGYVYRCHTDLYRRRSPVSHILDDSFNEETLNEFRRCTFFGDCNPCDLKVKTNRFQVFGHTSVEIRNISEKTAAVSP